jgi:hypothetical protein
MAELNWQDNSKEMFQKLIDGSPKPFRAMTEKKMMEGITKKAGDGGTVTEDLVIEIVKEITPKPFVAMAMKSIEPLLTKK